MYCDDCHDPVGMDLHEYVETQEKLGTVLCPDCRNGPRREDRVPDRFAALMG